MPNVLVLALGFLRWSLLLAGASFTLSGSGPFEPYSGPAPFLVVLQTEPWAMVVGSETPACVVYEGGLFIFRDIRSRDVLRYSSRRLSRQEQGNLLELLAGCSPSGGFKARYNLAPWDVTDQPELRMFFRIGGKTTTTRLYAWTMEGPAITKAMGEEMERRETVLPGQLGKVLERLRELSISPAQEWDAAYTEAILWPFPHARGRGLPWPGSLPQPGSRQVLTFPHRLSIYVAQRQVGELLRFFGRLPENSAVRFGGAKYSLALRPVFPNEPVWRRAFQASE